MAETLYVVSRGLGVDAMATTFTCSLPVETMKNRIRDIGVPEYLVASVINSAYKMEMEDFVVCTSLIESISIRKSK